MVRKRKKRRKKGRGKGKQRGERDGSNDTTTANNPKSPRIAHGTPGGALVYGAASGRMAGRLITSAKLPGGLWDVLADRSPWVEQLLGIFLFPLLIRLPM